MTLNEKQAALCASNSTDFSDLATIILNCTLKRADTVSHSGKLLSVPAEIMRRNGVSVEEIGPATMPINFGVQPDMRELAKRSRAAGIAIHNEVDVTAVERQDRSLPVHATGSGEDPFVVMMAPPSQALEPPAKSKRSAKSSSGCTGSQLVGPILFKANAGRGQHFERLARLFEGDLRE